ncbi:conserved hypothetical protein [Burkholderia latens]|uniref:hypothetical protein n=1 Tax=Burkholderia latens TaxID=488446 RepID=UPI0039A6343B
MYGFQPEPVAVVFYFDSAEYLRQFESFTAEPTPITRPHQNPATVMVWSVVGKMRFVDRREVVAEFPAEVNARTFADMANIVAAHV